MISMDGAKAGRGSGFSKLLGAVGNFFLTFSSRWDLVLLLVVAIGLRVWLLIASVDQISADKLLSVTPDTVNYVSMARGLVNGAVTNENGFFSFGPGYACFLALTFLLFGIHSVPAIVVQMVLSGLACLLIYKLGMILTRSYAASIIAGLLAATSYTSISLSCLLLSDSVYFFLFLSGLVLYLKGLSEGNWRHYIFSGILTGIAILTRPIGQFWLLPMIVIALVAHFTGRKESGCAAEGSFKTRIIKLGVCIGIILLLVSSWILRNNVVHGIPALAYTSAGGPVNVAALTLHRLENRPVKEIRREWRNQFKTDNDIDRWSIEAGYRMSLEQGRRVLRTYPREMLVTYFGLVWENLNRVGNYHRYLIPKYNLTTVGWEWKIRNSGWNYMNFCVSMLGLLILLLTRQYRAFFVLGLVYFYYAAMIGFTQWQSSRLFFPGQIAWAILIAVVLVSAWRFMATLVSGAKRTIIH